MSNQTAVQIFSGLLKQKQSSIDLWNDAPFKKAKYIGNTEKGDVGEDFLSEMLKKNRLR